METKNINIKKHIVLQEQKIQDIRAYLVVSVQNRKFNFLDTIQNSNLNNE